MLNMSARVMEEPSLCLRDMMNPHFTKDAAQSEVDSRVCGTSYNVTLNMVKGNVRRRSSLKQGKQSLLHPLLGAKRKTD